MVAARVADGDVDGDVDAPPDVSRRLPATTVTWPSRRRALRTAAVGHVDALHCLCMRHVSLVYAIEALLVHALEETLQAATPCRFTILLKVP